jgi:hypothetical protein
MNARYEYTITFNTWSTWSSAVSPLLSFRYFDGRINGLLGVCGAGCGGVAARTGLAPDPQRVARHPRVDQTAGPHGRPSCVLEAQPRV